MSGQDLEAAFKLIDEKGGGDFEGPKDPELIEKAEAALGLQFPPTYRKFLGKLGSGDIDGLEFYGLVGSDFENSSVPDAVWLTLNERKSGLPENLVLVYASGDGGYYAIDTKQVDLDGESPVVFYDPSGSIEKVANDYGEFMLSELKTIL